MKTIALAATVACLTFSGSYLLLRVSFGKSPVVAQSGPALALECRSAPAAASDLLEKSKLRDQNGLNAFLQENAKKWTVMRRRLHEAMSPWRDALRDCAKSARAVGELQVAWHLTSNETFARAMGFDMRSVHAQPESAEALKLCFSRILKDAAFEVASRPEDGGFAGFEGMFPYPMILAFRAEQLGLGANSQK